MSWRSFQKHHQHCHIRNIFIKVFPSRQSDVISHHFPSFQQNCVAMFFFRSQDNLGNNVSKWRTSHQLQREKFEKHNHQILRQSTPIGSMGRLYVYLPTWMVDFYGFHVGKYTNRPMDAMGTKTHTPNIRGISLDLSFSHLLRQLLAAWVFHTMLHFLQSSKAWKMAVKHICRLQQFHPKNAKPTIDIKAFSLLQYITTECII